MKRHKLNILIVDDNKLLAESLALSLQTIGRVTIGHSIAEAQKALSTEFFDIAFIDLTIEQEFDGLSILEKAVAQNTYSVILSAYEGDEQITKAYELGCRDYFIKGKEKITIEQVVTKFLLQAKDFFLESFIQNTFITNDEQTKDSISYLIENIHNNIPILLLGPTGTGKSLLAKKIHSIHTESKSFVEINCAAIPESLMESELFGYEKGAFTGATSPKKGLLLQANGGTLFLDEIGTLPSLLQMKLLKAIEEKVFYPVGSTTPVRSDFRIISATCDNIFTLLKNNTFRMDLFYRLSGINITIKPLFERKNDIDLLIQHFLKKDNRKIILKKEARTALINYSWPGNVRELEKVISILKNKSKGIIQYSDLPLNIINDDSQSSSQKSLVTPSIIHHAHAHGLNETMNRLKKEIISQTLHDNNMKVNKTIRQLRIATNTFYSSFEKTEPYSGAVLNESNT